MLFGIHHKAKLAFLFLGILLTMVGSSLWETRQLHDMNTAVASLYQDRLQPAAGLFALNDRMYAKRQLLESYLAAPTQAHFHDTQVQLAAQNKAIDSLLKSYQATYMVAEEDRVFQSVMTHLTRYNYLEDELLYVGEPASGITARELAQQFNRIHADVSHLTQIQLQVGQQLSRGSAVADGQATLLSQVKIALLVVLTLAILQAIVVDKQPLLPKNLKKFRLN
ncbi:MCP four helix bundle domain-containing protein [Hymenobacter sp. BT188]|nr:MCP four helix bundle domain-containing protein [Hymenobacter sp. BT188]